MRVGLIWVLLLGACGTPVTGVNPGAADSAQLSDAALDVAPADADTALDTPTDVPVAPPCDVSIVCDNPHGKVEFNFQGAPTGTQRTCTLSSTCSWPLAFNSPATLEPVAVATQAEVDATYALVASPQTGSVPAGKSAVFTIRFTVPTNGLEPPAAALVIPTGAMTFVIPVVAASCQAPDLEFSPDMLWLSAVSGQKAQGTVTLANQSCAPVDIVAMCINNGAGNPPGNNPCASPQYLSKYHGLAQDLTALTLPPSQPGGSDGLLPIVVEFHPPDDNKINAHDLLHIVYCATGSLAAGNCQVGYQTLNLTGNTAAGVDLPSVVLNVATLAPQVGQPVALAGVLTPGSWPLGDAWQWSLVKRPPGSLAWLAATTTTVGNLSVIPDVKGDYTVQASALTFNPIDPSQLAWSPAASVSWTAQ